MEYFQPDNLISVFEVGMDRSTGNYKKVLPLDGTAFNLGCGNKKLKGCINLDLPEWDYHYGIPCRNGEASTIHMYHFLEHVDDPVDFLKECQRCLMIGGTCNIVVPYATSELALQDLMHKARFVETTWKTLMENPYYNPTKFEWRFKVNINMIMGLNARNLCLVTQLVKF